jgi:pimeloyl-ACP methyl ester carboxylesterase
MVKRRTVLAGSVGLAGLVGAGIGATALAANGVIPGKSVVDRKLGFCDADVLPVHATAGPIVAGSFASTFRRRTVTFKIAYPPHSGDGSRLPVCLMLHGYGGDETSALTAGDYPAYLAAAVAGGTPPFALASVAGGNGYWHPHPDDDPLGMLIEEFLPQLAKRGLATDHPAVSGISMGGYGALLGGLTAPSRFSAIIANSPAVWRTYGESKKVNPGAFSSAAEWSQYGDLLSHAAGFKGLPIQIHIGKSDSFEPVVSSLRDRLPDPRVVHISQGCHDGTFWQAQAPTDLKVIGAALHPI